MITRRRVLLSSASCLLATPYIMAGTYQSGLELTLALDYSASMFRNTALDYLGGSDASVSFEHTDWHQQIAFHIAALKSDIITQQLLAQTAYIRVLPWSFKVLSQFSFERRLKNETDLDATISWLQSLLTIKCNPRWCNGTDHHVPIECLNGLPRYAYRRELDICTDEAPSIDVRATLPRIRQQFEANGGRVNVLGIDLTGKEAETLQNSVCSPDGLYLSASSWEACQKELETKMVFESS